jgi:hypothetical protein
MGAVFRPKDLPADWTKMARESIEDLSPDTKDSVIKIIDSWEGTKSEEKLKALLGHDKAESLMKNITRTTTTKNKAALTSDDQDQVKDMLGDSLRYNLDYRSKLSCTNIGVHVIEYGERYQSCLLLYLLVTISYNALFSSFNFSKLIG